MFRLRKLWKIQFLYILRSSQLASFMKLCIILLILSQLTQISFSMTHFCTWLSLYTLHILANIIACNYIAQYILTSLNLIKLHAPFFWVFFSIKRRASTTSAFSMLSVDRRIFFTFNNRFSFDFFTEKSGCKRVISFRTYIRTWKL